VREATSNDPGGPSGALMNEIAQATYNQTDFLGVMEIIDKRLNDKGKNWRHVFKALTVFDYCLHVGSVNVVQYAIDNIYIVKTLREFQYIDDSGRDQGANVRHKAKELTALLLNRSKLDEARKNRNWMNNRLGFGNMGSNMGMGGGNFYGNSGYSGSSGRLPSQRSRPERSGGHMRTNSLTSPDNRYGDDDGEMRQAIAESRRSAASKRVPKGYDEEAELKKAIEESAREAKAEEEKKGKATSSAGGGAAEVDLLGGFDDAFSTAGANSSMNNVNGMGSMNNVNNMGMMSSTSSFMQQQQQFGNTGSAANDLFDAFGGTAGAGANNNNNNNNFDPFGLNTGGGMNQGNMNQGMGGMGMDMGQGMGAMGTGIGGMSTGMSGMGMTSTNPYDTSMFGNSSNQFVSQTTMTTTSMAMSGVGGAGSSVFGQDMGGAFGQTSGVNSNSNNLLTGNNSMFDSGLPTSTASATADLLGGSTNAGGRFDGASGAFGSAFDGGMAAKTLPFGVNPNDPNSKIAEIARNSDRIDPFASLAASSTNNNPFGGTSTAGASSNNLLGGTQFTSNMMMASTPALSATPTLQQQQSQQLGTGGFSSTGMLGTGGSSLVDLSPAALATSNNASMQSFGQVNRNPFAASGGSNTVSTGNAGKQMSLNQMMAGGGGMNAGFSQASTPMGGNVGTFDQQMGGGMNAFGTMQAQQPMQTQQQMVFQQQQFSQQQHQQQVNPFGQQQNTSTTNTTNFFGL
ncbi:hypothetical protein GGI05_002905, partial [Coemansia sp. RSA 2603]